MNMKFFRSLLTVGLFGILFSGVMSLTTSSPGAAQGLAVCFNQPTGLGPQPCPTGTVAPYYPQENIVAGFAPAGANIPTYSASLIEGVPAASGTDVLCLSGKAGIVVRIWNWDVTGTQTTAGTIPVSININSAVDTGGTPGTTPTIIPHDSTDAVAGATLVYYTANPTIPTPLGAIRTQKVTLLAPASVVGDGIGSAGAIWNFPHNFATKPILLRGAAQQACLNWNAKTTSGNLIDSNITWTETVN